MKKALQSSVLYFHRLGEKVYIDGYRNPFKIISKASNLVTLRHTVTGCKIFLSPGWKCKVKTTGITQADLMQIDPIGYLQNQGLL